MIRITSKIYQAAVAKYVAEKGGLDFYANTVDPGTSEINQEGEVVLRKRGKGDVVARYPLLELGLTPEVVNQDMLASGQVRAMDPPGVAGLDLTDKRVVLGFCAAGLLFLGALCPVVNVPIVGSITYVQNGRGDGVLVLVIALVSAACVAMRRFAVLRLCGIASLSLIFTTLWLFHFKMSAARESLSGLEGNPFRGLADAALGSISLSWGWFLLLGGSVSLLVCAEVVATDTGLALPSSKLWPDSKEAILRSLPGVVAVCLAAGFALAIVFNAIG